MQFTPDFTPFAEKDMQKYAGICEDNVKNGNAEMLENTGK